MHKNMHRDGIRNCCGRNIAQLRKARNLSQRALADQFQLMGLDLSKNAVQQIERRERFVTDLELMIIANFFQISPDLLLESV